MREPVGGLLQLRSALNRWFEDGFIRPTALEPFRRPFPLDVRETDAEYVIEASLPGFKTEELDISVVENTLTIRAVRTGQEQTKKAGRYVRRERYEGEMSRIITLSTPIASDKVAATYEQGVLTVHIPKTEKATAKRITVQIK